MVRQLLFTHIFPADRAALLVAKFLKVNLEFKEVDPVREPKYKGFEHEQISHRSPTLIYDEMKIQSVPAIAGYLINLHDKDNKLYPKETTMRAKIDESLHYNNGVLLAKAYQAISTLMTGKTKYLPRPLKNEIKNIYDHLEDSIDKSWLCSDSITLADLCFIPSITTVELISNVSKERYPKLYKYIDNSRSVPYYKEVNQDGLDKLTKFILDRFERMRQ